MNCERPLRLSQKSCFFPTGFESRIETSSVANQAGVAIIFRLTKLINESRGRTDVKFISIALAGSMLALSGTASAQVLNDVSRGSYTQTGVFGTGGSGTASGNYLTGSHGVSQLNSFFVFDLTGINTPVTSATLSFNYPNGWNSGAPITVSFYDYTGSISALTGGTGGLAAFNDLGSGTFYGSTTISLGTTSFSLLLNAAALSAISGAAGGSFAIGGTISGAEGETFLGGNTLDAPPVTLALRAPAVAAVPEPATWAMMLVGFGVVGFSLRRRRRTHNLVQAA